MEFANNISIFGPQNMASISWAFAVLDVRNKPLMNAIASSAIAKLSHFSADAISRLAWSFEKIDVQNEPVGHAICAWHNRLKDVSLPQAYQNVEDEDARQTPGADVSTQAMDSDHGVHKHDEPESTKAMWKVPPPPPPPPAWLKDGSENPKLGEKRKPAESSSSLPRRSRQSMVQSKLAEDATASVRSVKILGMPEGIEVGDVSDAFGHGVCIESIAVRGTVAWIEFATAAEAQYHGVTD
eukprot:gnl/MRDRNA2_/MRDRNA2_80339_c0_seq1.p1 gnl/MRDRNA2_/MRDRNA2_80339_c0~~gnl/MRDRNA2_/MRDRNA2_80339_c0_seq1.p1  ORF type:complete len:240 (+),score=55.99 gnl/MRDRNA2_/MRDRNA2_80339_c0_seq1:351-1070(+)